MKTAVSWLEEQLKKQGFLYDLDIEAAKQMEKEHIIKAVNITEQEAVDFCNEQVKHYYDHEGMFGAVPEAGINYYNETYNDNE